MLKYIFVDLDDTIFDFHKAEKIAVSKTLEHFELPHTDDVIKRYHEINKAHWKMLEKGIINRSQVKIGRFESLVSEIADDPEKIDAKELAKYYEKCLSIGHYFIDGAEKFLKEASGKYKLYLVSNGTAAVQKGRIESSDISRYFERIFVSENIGFNKPSKEYFDVCFDEIKKCDKDFRKDQSVIIGDSLTSDISGGINAGIKTVWFNPNCKKINDDIIPDFEINNFDEFEDKVAENF